MIKTVDGYDLNEEKVNEVIKDNELDTNKISDGYHTFGELYDHRVILYIALINTIGSIAEKIVTWKSWKHSDGRMLAGWFVAGIGMKKGQQITYHLPEKVFKDVNAPELEKAPEWDGHTPADVLKRIKKYLY